MVNMNYEEFDFILIWDGKSKYYIDGFKGSVLGAPSITTKIWDATKFYYIDQMLYDALCRANEFFDADVWYLGKGKNPQCTHFDVVGPLYTTMDLAIKNKALSKLSIDEINMLRKYGLD
jgi:hypothetical protein